MFTQKKKSIRLLALILASCLMSFSLIACGDKKESETADKGGKREVVIYSPNQDAEVEAIIPAFEEATGIKVILMSMGTGDVMARIAAEKENPQCDINWGAINLGFYKTNPDLWEKYVSPNESSLPEEFKNTTGFFTSYKLSGSAALLINEEVFQELGLNPDEFKGYKDLLREELKGHIAMGDATASSSAYAELTNMLLVMGDEPYDEKAWDFIEQFVAQLDGTIISSSSQIYKGVVDGEYAVGVTYEDPCITLLEDGAKNIRLIYPEEGSVWLPGGSAIVKNAPHMEEAKAFIDFLISDEGQAAIAKTSIRPIRTDLKNESDYIRPFAELNQVFEDIEYTSDHKAEWQSRWLELVSQ